MKYLIPILIFLMLLASAEAKYSPALEMGGNITMGTSYINGAGPAYVVGYSSSRYTVSGGASDEINAAYAAGYKHITFQPGYNYTIDAKVTIPAYCSLDGVISPNWYNVTSLSITNITRLLITYSASSAIDLKTGASAKNLEIYYPDQVKIGTPTVYPPTFGINGTSDVLISNILALNPYILIYSSTVGDRSTFEKIKGHPIYKGIVVLSSADVGHIRDIEFTPFHLNGEPIWQWTNANGYGIYLGCADAWTVENFANLGYLYGIYINGNKYTKMSKIWIEGTKYPFYATNSYRFMVEQSTFASYVTYPTGANPAQPSTTYAVFLENVNRSTFTDCELVSSGYGLYAITGTASRCFNNRISASRFDTWAMNTTIALGYAGYIIGYNNTVSGCTIDGGSVARCFGFLVAGQGNKFEDNRIMDVAGYAIDLYATDRFSQIKGNTFDGATSDILIDNGVIGHYIVNNYLETTATITDSSGSVSKRVMNNYGFNPTNPSAPAVPASTVGYTNNFGYPCMVCVLGGTVSATYVGGVNTGFQNAAFVVPPGATIAMVYSSAPTWTWVGL